MRTTFLVMVFGLMALVLSHQVHGQDVENMIVNPDFQNGIQGWNLEVHNGFVVANLEEEKKDGVGDNRSMIVNIDNIKAGSEVWRLQFKQVNHVVEQGERYTWGFWAKAEEFRPAQVWVGMEADPWSTLGTNQGITIETEWKEFFFTFTASQDYANTRLSVQLAATDVNAWFDHERFYAGEYVPDDLSEIPQAVSPKGRLAAAWATLKTSAD